MYKRILLVVGSLITILSCFYTYIYNDRFQLANNDAYPTYSNVEKLKVITFNIRGARNDKGNIQLDEIVNEIKFLEPDIIALQEIDVRMPRSKFYNQIQYISQKLEMNYVYVPNINFIIGSYGNAIISKFPILGFEHFILPSKIEPRGVLKATIAIDNKELNVYTTHLGINSKEREVQFAMIESLLANDTGPKILLGDFNAKPTDKNVQTLRIHLIDPSHQQTLTTLRPYSTQIDYVFHSRDFINENLSTRESIVSDHNPVLSTLLFK